MAKQRSSFAKLQRDKAKKERAAERLSNRQKRTEDKKPEEETPKEVSVTALVSGKGVPSPDELLRIVEDLTNRKESGKITDDEFEEAKIELFARLT